MYFGLSSDVVYMLTNFQDKKLVNVPPFKNSWTVHSLGKSLITPMNSTILGCLRELHFSKKLLYHIFEAAPYLMFENDLLQLHFHTYLEYYRTF